MSRDLQAEWNGRSDLAATPAKQATLPSSRQSVWHRAISTASKEGVLRAAGLGLRRVTAPLLEVGALELYACDLAGPLPGAALPDGYTVREATAAELADVLRGSDPERTAAALRERFRRGHRCFVVEDPGGRIVHSRWVTESSPYVPELRRTLLLQDGDVYFYDGFTHGDARRLGLDGVVRCAIFEDARRRGCRRVLSYVRADNPRGLRAARRWQRPAGRVRYLRLGSGAPWLFGSGSIAPLTLSRESRLDYDEDERAARADGWGRWFRGWLAEPLERRSTGFSALPAEYFDAVSSFVVDRLALRADDDVLDVGCASGGVTARVAESCRALLGLDLTPGLLGDALASGIRTGAGGAAGFAAADARVLPLRSRSFDKVYCMGMIHTLPSRQDGLQVVRELVRVCRPGGRVLVGGVPDRSRRWAARVEAWRRGGARARLALLAAVLLPASLKSALRRWSGRPVDRLVYLEYDLESMRRLLEAQGLRAEVVPFPADFWSRDFRITRASLLVSLPEDAA